jgi:hypothetical protein
MFRRRAIRKKLLIIIPLFIITGYHVLIQEFIRSKNLEIEKKEDSILRLSIYSVSSYLLRNLIFQNQQIFNRTN